MSMTGLDTFDTTVQKSDLWLKEIMEELGWNSRHNAYHALRAVLLTLRDRLTIDEAADLSAQLPLLIRGVFFDSWDPSEMPVKLHNKNEFLARVRSHFRNDQQVEPEAITKAVFKVIKRKVTQGEINQVKGMMPEELRELWE